MTPADLNTALDDLGLSTAEFAAIVNRNWRTVHRWRWGDAPVPDWVGMHIERLRENANPAASVPGAGGAKLKFPS